MNVVLALMEAVNYVASDTKKYSQNGKQKALNILVMNVADYLITAYEEE